ncbi:MAG: exonuclease domain-containing protein [Bacteroidia bacterium]
MYAIVDIETTGGQPSANAITEICIIIHNGKQVVQRFETLINPEIPIPYYIEAFTGITNQMVKDAPTFYEVAPKISELLKDKVFVAHNVNFDYNFIKHQLHLCNISFDAKRLCTVRLSKKIFPGKKSYSLGNLTASLNIVLNNRHRAGGDAEATALLFEKILAQPKSFETINEMLNKGSKEQQLPPNVSKSDFNKLPSTAGIYYFVDEKGKALYVGKAKNIKSRVSSHFSGKLVSKQKHNFLRNIYGISFLQTGNELLAALIESYEIKRLWPDENRAQKKFTQTFALYDYIDQNGKIRLGIDRIRQDVKPIATFANFTEALSYLNKVVDDFNLCPVLCNLQQPNTVCNKLQKNMCMGNCKEPENVMQYNIRVNEFIEKLELEAKTYFISEKGRNAKEQCIIIYEPGNYVGYCYINKDALIDFDVVKEQSTALKFNPVMDSILMKVVADEKPKKDCKIYMQYKMAMV